MRASNLVAGLGVAAVLVGSLALAAAAASPTESACAEAVAIALPGGGVRLDWREVPGATTYFVYRSAGSGEPDLLTTVMAAQPGVVGTVVGTLPEPRVAMGAAVVDGKAYLTGGGIPEAAQTRQILRFDPSNGTVQVAATLPSARTWTTAAALGGHVYIAGGWDGDEHLDEILRFTPATGEFEVAGTLPSPRSYLTSAVVGGVIYFFAGNDGLGSVLDDVLRFDPATGTVELLPDPLPEAREVMATVYDGTYVWLLGGGSLAPNGAEDAIVRFDPATGESVEVTATLPETRSRLAGVTDGRHVYALGGRTDDDAHASVYRWDPVFQDLRTLAPGLPAARANGAAVRIGGDTYYFGGSGPTDTQFQDTIYRLRFEGSGATTYADHDTVQGTVYGYRVVADVGEVPEGGCPEAVVTAIPDLPGLAVVLAAAGGAGTLLLAQRRGPRAP